MSKKSANSPLLSPKLWNAHKRLPPRALSRISRAGIAKRIEAEDWASLVSEEVAGFIEKAMRNEETAVLGKKEMIECIKDPTSYFRFPKNVPVQYRKQIYLPSPEQTVCLMRTPHLPPKYAAFKVPLRWNKFDLKSYLAEVYGVEVLHIRSFVQNGRGKLKRPAATKKMTVELIEPFEYPEEPEDMSLWDKDTFWGASKDQIKNQKRAGPGATTEENEDQRKSIAEQAQELLARKGKWKPTWQSISVDARAMKGSATSSM